MQSRLPNLVGYIVLARHTKDYRPAEPYLVLGHEQNGDNHHLSLLPTTGGIYSDRPFAANLDYWEIVGYLQNHSAVEALLDSVLTVLRDSTFTLTDDGRARLETVAGELSRLQRVLANRRDRSPEKDPRYGSGCGCAAGSEPSAKASPFDDLFQKADDLPVDGNSPEPGPTPSRPTVVLAVIGPGDSKALAEKIYGAIIEKLGQ